MNNIKVINGLKTLQKGHGYEWTKDNHCTKGLKVHVEYDTDLRAPVCFSFTAANVNDITEAKKLDIKSKMIYVFDKGYYDYKWWHEKPAYDKISYHFVIFLLVAIKLVDRKRSVRGDSIFNQSRAHAGINARKRDRLMMAGWNRFWIVD